MTRDSALFSWPVIIGGIAAFLATAGDPRGWDYVHWMNAIVAVTTIIGGKLGTSPLAASTDPQTVKVNR